MPMSPAQQKLIDLAKTALRRRDTLDGAGQAIMRAYGLDKDTARQLQLDEVNRRRREQQASISTGE